jgi:SAM-dependent methyltransferase
MDRAVFAERQAQMTSNWYEAVKRREGDVDAYIAKRQAAYLDRWREAGRFAADGATVLDVGGGNLFPALMEHIKRRGFDYFYIDVDQSAVDASRNLAQGYGLKGSQFARGFNDQFQFLDGQFDAVFSSHCLEHSFDLTRTLQELNRIIKHRGNLLMAVPFGWEENPEHPYFFGPNHWIALVEDAGFEVRVAQVGREYPESGYDFFIAARKVGRPDKQPRVDPADYRKDTYQFVAHSSPCIRYSGNLSTVDGGHAAHLRGHDWAISITLPGAREVLPIFKNHDWSGMVEINGGGKKSYHDLFSWFATVQPVRHDTHVKLESEHVITVRCSGKNSASWSTEAVLYGLMFR